MNSARRRAKARRRTCEDKRRYESKAEVTRVIKSQMRLGSPALKSYKCPFCDGYHLTKKRKPSKEATS